MLWRVTVQREDPAKPLGFSPHERQAQYNTATRTGDAVFWFNEDQQTNHQPVPDSGAWNTPEIAPGNSSDQLELNSVGTFEYKCKFHDDETAVILVANPVIIAAGADPLFGSPLKIGKEQSVSWGNADANAHQPCPDTGTAWFDAPIESGDLSAPIPFANPGTVNYHCAIHPHEKGQIVVT